MRTKLESALAAIFSGIEQLREIAPHRRFTIDGRLVGDIGEIVAAEEFDILLDPISRERHDGVTSDGRNVQIKATFQNALTIRREPELYLGLKLFRNGGYEVAYNGPGHLLTAAFGHRKDYGQVLLSFPIEQFRRLSETVREEDRVPRRKVHAR
ncbi:MAG TPA: hypothetical protein VIL09_18965 [Microvirga sp.]|jgi:hypothetical protein